MNETVHYMTLLKHPFLEVKSGRKTVEMRLYDEKRRLICPGDKIVFSLADNIKEKVTAAVIDTYIYESFYELAASFSAEELGFAGSTPEAIGDFMMGIYGANKTAEYKAFAIKINIQE